MKIDITEIIKAIPELSPHLSPAALRVLSKSEYKTYDFFLRLIISLVNSLYVGNMTKDDFIDMMANAIQGQVNQAVIQAWQDEGLDGPFPQYLNEYATYLILNEYKNFVDNYAAEIYAASQSGESVNPFIARAQVWANRFNEAYNGAKERIALENGGKLKWIYDGGEHCDTCAALNGLVAYATEWESSGFHPQTPPNKLLDCGGWNCKCSLEITTARRSPKVMETLINIAVSRKL